LTPAAKQRALECLSRFGQRLQDMHASSVRTAGTSALRRARDSAEFLREAERALGQPIEVISGIEEARLIFRGATERLPPAEGLRLVLDIGGGSTELILGEGKTPRALESLRLGCVSITERFFDAGVIDRQCFDKARLAVRLELRPVKAFFRDSTELEAIGTSGTIIATELVARETDLIESNDLTPAVVEQLIERVLDFGNVSELSLPGLSERRAQVWPGGLAILIELLKVLRVEHLRVRMRANELSMHWRGASTRTMRREPGSLTPPPDSWNNAGKCGSWIARLNQSSCIGNRPGHIA
jgi:exopolyphosphatase/guanosine-5'-triphosphate,3'-diphosphate pyrophosphatase